MVKFLIILSAIWYVYWQEQGYFRATEIYYCKKNKKDCSKCTCWSCPHDQKSKEY